jgi:hypothetical protein
MTHIPDPIKRSNKNHSAQARSCLFTHSSSG